MNEIDKKDKIKLVLNLDIRRNEFMPKLYPYPPGENRESFTKKLIDVTHEFFSIIKVNYQFIADLSEELIKDLVDYIKNKDCIPWVDYKLGDIGTTNEYSLYNLNKMGFEGVTIHQIIGYEEGLQNILKMTKKYKMDVISLAYMSHKGADDYFNIELQDGVKLYQRIIKDGIRWGVSGFVIGATVNEEVLENILDKFPNEYIYYILLPGFGAQRGNYSLLNIFHYYDNIIALPANGREIIYAWMNSEKKFPIACREAAKKFQKQVFENFKGLNYWKCPSCKQVHPLDEVNEDWIIQGYCSSCTWTELLDLETTD